MIPCGHCNEPFKPHGPVHRFCSRLCAQRWRRERASVSRRDRYVACSGPGCDRIFIPRNVKQKFCSERCSYEIRKMRRRRSPVERLCKAPDCRKPFIPGQGGKLYCSSRCWKRLAARRRRASKHGREQRRVYDQRYYEENGNYVRWAARRRYKKRTPDSAVCPNCGNTFTPRPKQKWCTPRCGREGRR